MQLPLVAAAALPALATAATWRDYTPTSRTPASCPDYAVYAQTRHGTPSSGPLGLPDMRPSPACRTFNSSAVEGVIGDMAARLRDPDLARLFANTMSSTLDTTVKYFDANLNLAFIITGDITAQWLRDTGNQFAHLYRLLPKDEELRKLVKAVINTEARYIAEYPYCGSFQPPPESGLEPSHNGHAEAVTVNPPVNNQTVFECKYELDSLAAFLKMSRSYYDYTKDASFINDNWNAAIDQIMTLIRNQSQSTWSDNWNFVSYYNWTGSSPNEPVPVNNGGNNEPVRANGLIASSHRPSDDICVFNYITPVNAMMAVELDKLATTLSAAGDRPDVAAQAASYAATVRAAVLNHTVVGDVFAYETNGYGGVYIMDDANVPSLVSLPYLGFLDRNDGLYRRTKAAMFSRENPYYAPSRGGFEGIGGPHVAATDPWPMAQISAIFGSDDDDEIRARLALVANSTSGLGLVHESVSMYNGTVYTRSWFAWGNSFFAEMLLDLAHRKPGLIFTDATPYVVG